MLCLLLAAALPWLYWDHPASTAASLKQAGIERLYVPAGQEDAWKALGFDARVLDATHAAKAAPPGVRYRMDIAAATNVPWVDANGWRFERDSGRTYYYDVPSRKAALAAAEAYAYGADAAIHPEDRDLTAFGKMLKFLREIDQPGMKTLANIGVIDDGSGMTGEALNLLARRNLLFRLVKAPDPKLDLNIQIGRPEFPKSDAANPARFAALVRRKLTDEKRLVRVFGSDIVLVHLTGDDTHVRLHLINYGGGKVEGLRVRVRGPFFQGKLAAYGLPDAALMDYGSSDNGTEFTIPALDVYAVVDLTK